MSGLSDLLKKMEKVKTSDEKAGLQSFLLKLRTAEISEKPKTKPVVLERKAAVIDANGEIIRFSVRDGKLVRLWQKGTGNDTGSGFNFTWIDNSSTQKEMVEKKNNRIMLKIRAEAIPRERALVIYDKKLKGGEQDLWLGVRD